MAYATYFTKVSIAANIIIIETFVGGTKLIDTVNRGPREDIDLSAVMLTHKADASMVLGTDIDAQATAARVAQNGSR